MSFFDEGDEPRRSPRPRRPAAEGVAVDPQTLRVRQAVAVGVGLLVLILLLFGVRACQSSAKKRGLREYNSDVRALVRDSDREVGQQFFQQLGGGRRPDQTLDLGTQVNQLRAVSEDLVGRARKLDPPDDMRPAQSALLLVLEMRRDALRKIAQKVRSAQASGDTAQQAIIQITGQLQLFYASDLLYKYRVAPVIGTALKEAGVEGQTVYQTRFFPSVKWLDPANVAPRLGTTLSASSRGGPVAPGSHGHALTSVTVNGQALGSDVNRLPAGSNLVFTVKLQNQGENDETGVIVKVSIEGSGPPVTAQATVPQTSKGSEASVDVPLRNAPPVGTPVQINVSVEPVPGEKTLDNNRKSFPALFAPS